MLSASACTGLSARQEYERVRQGKVYAQYMHITRVETAVPNPEFGVYIIYMCIYKCCIHSVQPLMVIKATARLSRPIYFNSGESANKDALICSGYLSP